MNDKSEYMNVHEAREYLGVSKAKMSRLIREGIIATEEDPLDKRVKIVKREDVEKLKARSAPGKRTVK